ncbi:MAG: 3-deoxy-D-manno-octulosonic acid transferase [Paludibacteraceae bacterium]|nr:3-deoxy-D-manno-octulosonic acid transferase [Paludibacteraceae bacterium]
MWIYFLAIRIAALFGHRKARKLVAGQQETLARLKTEFVNYKAPIWIHAASVGEFEQARPLIERLRREQPNRKIVLTFFSPSGYEMRKNYNQVDTVLYLPFATRRNARLFLDALQPKMAIFVKYEFWPAYLRELKKRKIRTYSISAIFRPGQLFFLPWGKMHLRLLKCFTHIFVQDESSYNLLQKHGIKDCSVAGDTRFDRMQEVMANRKQVPVVEEFIKGAERVIVAGSTWPKDEEMLVRYIIERGDLQLNGTTKLVLVPHEINDEHLHLIFQMLQGRMVRYSVVSEQLTTNAGNVSTASVENILHLAHVLVIDTMGLLSSLYPYGQVAYVGGGFGVGIHNTVEAAVYGMPVLFGPNYSHFREAKGLIAAGAARSVKKYKELKAALDDALVRYEEMGAKATEYVAAETGATDKIYTKLFAN